MGLFGVLGRPGGLTGDLMGDLRASWGCLAGVLGEWYKIWYLEG